MAGDAQTPGAGARCGCGRAVEAGHRYCPTCGSLVGHLAGDGGPGSAVGSPLLDPASVPPAGAGEGGATADGVVRTGRSGPARLATIAGAVVLGLLAWGLFRQPSGEIAPDRRSGDEAAADAEGGDEEGDREGDDGAEADRTTTTGSVRTTRSIESTTSVPEVVARPDGTVGPLLGEETGLTLVVEGSGSSSLQLLDLDTGELRFLGPTRGAPRGQLGSSLVLTGPNGETLLLDLTDPGAGTLELGESGGLGEAAWIDDDRVWLVEGLGATDEGPELVAYDETGQEVERAGPLRWRSFAYPGLFLARPPEVVYQPGGGLYRRDGDGYRLVAGGQPLAVGRRLALVEQCDQAMACRLRWYDVESGEAVAHPDPPLDDALAIAIVGDDRWLVGIGDGEPPRLIDIAAGQAVRGLSPDLMGGPFGQAIPISDDGRWLLDHGPEGIVVIDLDRGTEWPLEGVTSSLGGAAVFIESVG